MGRSWSGARQLPAPTVPPSIPCSELRPGDTSLHRPARSLLCSPHPAVPTVTQRNDVDLKKPQPSDGPGLRRRAGSNSLQHDNTQPGFPHSHLTREFSKAREFFIYRTFEQQEVEATVKSTSVRLFTAGEHMKATEINEPEVLGSEMKPVFSYISQVKI